MTKYYAKVADGVVYNTISATPEFIKTYVDGKVGEWIEYDHRAFEGQIIDPSSGNVASGVQALRANAAQIGGIYDSRHDVFMPPKPYPSWKIDSTKWRWVAPVQKPEDGKMYEWNELDRQWVEYTPTINNA